MRLPASSTRRSQPQERPLVLNRKNPLGAVLDAVWLGNDLTGQAIGRNLVAPPPSGTILKPGPYGQALYSAAAVSTSEVDIPGAGVFPYLLLGFGYFNDSAGNWRLAAIGEGGYGNGSAIRLESATAVSALLQYNFGTAQILPITLGAGVNSGLPICALLQVFSPTDYRFYANGLQANGSTSPGPFIGFTKAYAPADTLQGGVYLTGYGFGRALTDAQALQITRNPQMLWDAFQPRQSGLFVPSGGAIALQGAAIALASATGALSTVVPVAGMAIGVATASGMLSAVLPLAGSAAAVATAAGTMTLGVAISGSAIAAALATGALSTAVPLAGAAAAHASASGQATLQIALSGAAVASGAATGALSVSGSAALAGNAVATAVASGALSVAIPLAGVAQVHAAASGNLSNAQPLAGAAVAVLAASGNLVVNVSVSGVALAHAFAAGSLTVQIPLSGNAVLHASAAGLLSGGQAGWASDPRFTVWRGALDTMVAAKPRNWTTYAH